MINKIRIIILTLMLLGCHWNAFAEMASLPPDFISSVSKIYQIPAEFAFCGGAEAGIQNPGLKHYPIIMIAGNRRGSGDWQGENSGNAQGQTNVYQKLIQAGFFPQELWFYQYAPQGQEMRNIEELTNGLKQFIYALLWYTKSTRVQILAHGEGAVLAQAAIKKYHLYNLIHAAVYIAAPMHGSPKYTYGQALVGEPVCANLALGSDFLQDLILPDVTAQSFPGSEGQIKYMTIYSGQADQFFQDYPDSPVLLGADNRKLVRLNHDGLRAASESSAIFIPFLSDPASKRDITKDLDHDGFTAQEYGGNDCNDSNAAIFPGAEEISADNIDQDCNGLDKLPVRGKDFQAPIIGQNRHE